MTLWKYIYIYISEEKRKEQRMKPVHIREIAKRMELAI